MGRARDRSYGQAAEDGRDALPLYHSSPDLISSFSPSPSRSSPSSSSGQSASPSQLHSSQPNHLSSSRSQFSQPRHPSSPPSQPPQPRHPSSSRSGRSHSSHPSDARRRYRCAIYTRKSSDEGLDQSFNSLDAQRDACEAYVTSQKHEGWVIIGESYDDGGFSGGSMQRPALQRLLEDVSKSRIDIVVVYKVDKLTLGDPAVQYLDLHGETDPECPSLLCPVREGGSGGADKGQDRPLKEERHVDGRTSSAWL